MSSLTSLLLAKLKKELKSVAENEFSEFGVEKLKDNIDKTVYSTDEGEYNRTMAMRNSSTADVSINDDINIEIYNNPELMNYRYPSSNSSKWGNDHRDDIVGWLNDGHKMWDHGYYDGKEFIEKAKKDIEKNSKKVLIDGLKKRGIRAYHK